MQLAIYLNKLTIPHYFFSFYFEYKGEECQFLIHEKSTKSKFYEWLIEERKITIDEWFEDHKKNYFEKISSLMRFLESNGIKTKILCWEEDYLDLIRSDVFIYNRFIPIEYREENFDSIRKMMTKHPHLTINSDYDNFSDPPKDHHPSRECHEVISEAVINSIRKDLDNQEKSYVFDGAKEAIKDIGGEDAFNQEYGLRFINASKSLLNEAIIDELLKNKKH